jgi:predicted nuclease of predicted toxin-antitoxin system
VNEAGSAPVFFLDRALGKRTVAGVLREAGQAVEVHADHFADDAADTDWLPQVAAKGWIVLTKDANIAKRPLERAAVEYAGAKVFYFNNSNATGAAIASAFVLALPKIAALVASTPGPLIVAVHRDGRVEVRLPPPVVPAP